MRKTIEVCDVCQFQDREIEKRFQAFYYSARDTWCRIDSVVICPACSKLVMRYGSMLEVGELKEKMRVKLDIASESPFVKA